MTNKKGLSLLGNQICRIRAKQPTEKIVLDKKDFGIIKNQLVGLTPTAQTKVKKIKKKFKLNFEKIF